MTLAEILASLFPHGHGVHVVDGLIDGVGALIDGRQCHVLGVANDTALGVEGAITLAGRVLRIAREEGSAPILMLVDSGGQRMSRRDELLGLNEYLAHLAKTLRLAERAGHRTVGLLYGHSVAGAFLATALACGTLVALPGANPEVMDLPSMARVTKLPIAVLAEKARTTPIFAPGLDNLASTGAFDAMWDPNLPLAAQFAALLATPAGADARDRRGLARGGRPKAAPIAERVARLALDDA